MLVDTSNSFIRKILEKTYTIAEIGINHGGDIELAKKLIESASRTGCDAVKFQTYITEARAPKGNKEIFEILKNCELQFDSFGILKSYAESLGLDFFSTPFDEQSIDYLESIDVEIYKVASFDIVNTKLLKKLALTQKPLIISTGMSDISEIKNALSLVEKSPIILLHCVSAYPTEEHDANLNSIKVLEENFPSCLIGQSDHTNSIKVPLFAVSMGAKVIEKHYKINEAMDCIDSPVSITENQMKEMVQEIRNLEKIMGDFVVQDSEAQSSSHIFRRES